MTVRCLCSTCHGEIYWATAEDYAAHVKLKNSTKRPAAVQLRLWNEAP